MKTDRDWIDCGTGEDGQIADLALFIRKIQADAIRWATNLSGPLRGQTALAKADELDPPEPKKPL